MFVISPGTCWRGMLLASFFVTHFSWSESSAPVSWMKRMVLGNVAVDISVCNAVYLTWSIFKLWSVESGTQLVIKWINIPFHALHKTLQITAVSRSCASHPASVCALMGVLGWKDNHQMFCNSPSFCWSSGTSISLSGKERQNVKICSLMHDVMSYLNFCTSLLSLHPFKPLKNSFLSMWIKYICFY